MRLPYRHNGSSRHGERDSPQLRRIHSSQEAFSFEQYLRPGSCRLCASTTKWNIPWRFGSFATAACASLARAGDMREGKKVSDSALICQVDYSSFHASTWYSRKGHWYQSPYHITNRQGNEDSHTNIINHDKYVIPMETHQNTRFSIKTSLIMMNIYIYIYICKAQFVRDSPPRNCKSGGGIPPGNEDSHTNIIIHDKYVIPMEIH